MFGERLLMARKRSGLSLRGLAEKMGHVISAQAIGKYERGEMQPGSTAAIALAKALSVPLGFLLNPSEIRISGIRFRKAAATTVKERNRVEADVVDAVDRYLQIEEILGIDSHEWRRPQGAPYPVGSLEEAEAAAEKIRRAWKLGSDPIPDMVELLEERGIKVVEVEGASPVDGLSCDVQRVDGGERIPVILASRARGIERFRMTLAHELGHLVMEVAPTLDEEKAAKRFAGAFLVPRKTLIGETGDRRRAFGFVEIMQFKAIYRISASALIVRLRDVDVISSDTMTRIFRGVGRTWRKEEPFPAQGPGEQPQRFHRLVLRALAEEIISLPKASELLRKKTSEIIKDMTGGEG